METELNISSGLTQKCDQKRERKKKKSKTETNSINWKM